MAQFNEAVLTRKGTALLAKVQAEEKNITITRAVTGNGEYEDGEDISFQTALKNQMQSFGLETVERQNETNVFIHFTITNHLADAVLSQGYYVTEIGIMAEDPDEGEILYAIAIGETGKCDYLPSYNNLLPAVIGVDFLIEVGNADRVEITTDFSAYATKRELDRKADDIGYDGETGTLLLKSGEKVIGRCTITFRNSSLATEEEVREMAKELMEVEGSVPSIATDEDIDDLINGLDEL